MSQLYSKQFIFLQREAYLIRASLYSGLEALGKASAQRKALYYQSFFMLSIGIERLGKLIILLTSYPNNPNLKRYSHNIVEIIRDALNMGSQFKKNDIPELQCEILESIISCLSDFSQSDRYFHLDNCFDSNKQIEPDPLTKWYDQVSTKILKKYYKQITKTKYDYSKIASVIEAYVINLQIDETCNNMSLLQILENQSEKINRYAVLHIFDLLVCMTNRLYEVSDKKRSNNFQIPVFPDFFRELSMERSMAFKRKKWEV